MVQVSPAKNILQETPDMLGSVFNKLIETLWPGKVNLISKENPSSNI